MAETAPEIRALAFVVHHIRPTWPRTLIEAALASDNRDLGTLARAAVMASQNPSTRHPNGIGSTFPGADKCTICEQRERTQTTQPPRVERCSKCGHIDSEHHNCRPMKPTPDWHNRRRRLAAKYTHDIRAAEACGDWQTVAQLKTQWRTELANNPDSYRVEILNA